MGQVLLLLFAVVAYLIGGIPFGLLIAKAKGIDIRKVGSGNIGTTNVARALGKKYALLVFFLDFLKGALPVMALTVMMNGFSFNLKSLFFTFSREALYNAGCKAPSIISLAVLLGAFAVLGHCFSPYLKFRGGKGIATSAGATLMLLPLSFCVSVGIWILLILLFRYVSLASICAALSLPFSFLLIYSDIECFKYSWAIYYCLFIAVLTTVKHIPNIKRLVSGKEPRVGEKKESERSRQDR
ncbi:MAG: glycerol-3-phosphate 1-O-acyltransferase PlsY [Planctomycetota bacterium]|nr:glycerol-3-phosphate 1-O-acyltransferase PlsY [Planctomycetota bacterium]